MRKDKMNSTTEEEIKVKLVYLNPDVSHISDKKNLLHYKWAKLNRSLTHSDPL